MKRNLTAKEKIQLFHEELNRRKDIRYANKYHKGKLEVDIGLGGKGLVDLSSPIDYVSDY